VSAAQHGVASIGVTSYQVGSREIARGI